MARSRKVEPKVKALLIQNKANRNSDKLLLLEFWEQNNGLILTPQQRAIFMDATPAESITRARRSLRGEYPGSAKVEQGRFERFQEEQSDHSSQRSFWPFSK